MINDQYERLKQFCAKAGLPVYPWHGDISQGVKSQARKDPRGVLLITPESLEALFVLRGLEIPTLFLGTRAIVIDELHALLDNERGVHLRSLLTRLELAVGRRIRRVGLSATLSEMRLVKEYLRPEAPDEVRLLESSSESTDLLAQIRGYQIGANENDSDGTAAKYAVAEHVFTTLRGKTNLVFAGSRQNVEWYSDALRKMSEEAQVPLEFLPHHASLSREYRLDLEKRLKSGRPTTAVCTSTLELGIDIGDIDCVSQIGPPFSVASLRQRLGRSGRRVGKASILRMYSIEMVSGAESHPLNRMHLDFVRSVAMLELLVNRWCEPPTPQALNLSTLTHQILSVIAERGGVSAGRLYKTLCVQGPFRRVNSSLFTRVLRHLGGPDVALIEQAADGSLLLGAAGERLVEHYSFYAVFQTFEEYRIIANGKLLGTLPLVAIYTPGMTIIFAGRRWRILDIHDRDKVIEVVSAPAGRTPPFGGGGGLVHDRVVAKMKEVLSDSYFPAYLDAGAARLLQDARSEFRRLGLERRSICEISDRSCLIASWAGSVKNSTLALALRAKGYRVAIYDGFLEVSFDNGMAPVESALEEVAQSSAADTVKLLSGRENFIAEKYHPYLSPELLLEDAISSRVDLEAMPGLARTIMDLSG